MIYLHHPYYPILETQHKITHSKIWRIKKITIQKLLCEIRMLWSTDLRWYNKTFWHYLLILLYTKSNLTGLQSNVLPYNHNISQITSSVRGKVSNDWIVLAAWRRIQATVFPTSWQRLFQNLDTFLRLIKIKFVTVFQITGFIAISIWCALKIIVHISHLLY